jgi:hypothetical protein
MIRLWDTATSKQVGSGIQTVENQAAFAHVLADGRSVLVLSRTGEAWQWPLDPGVWATTACRIANRHLTRAEWRSVLSNLPYDPACTG